MKTYQIWFQPKHPDWFHYAIWSGLSLLLTAETKEDAVNRAWNLMYNKHGVHAKMLEITSVTDTETIKRESEERQREIDRLRSIVMCG